MPSHLLRTAAGLSAESVHNASISGPPFPNKNVDSLWTQYGLTVDSVRTHMPLIQDSW